MKPQLGIILIFFFFSSCFSKRSTEKENTKLKIGDITYLYIHDSQSENSTPVDSLMVLRSGYEQSLDLYKETDSICKAVQGLVYLSIFKLNNEKFAIIIDSTTKVYKFNINKYQRIIEIPWKIDYTYNIKFDRVDINSDSFEDIVFQISSGGSYGEACFCFFYNPVKKTLLYDDNSELRNIELNLKEKKVKSTYSFSSAVFAIEKYSFIKIEQTNYLGYTTDDRKFDNLKEVIKFDKYGKILNVDTIEYK